MTATPAKPHALSDTAVLARAAKIKTHLIPLTIHFATDRLTALA